ncbi:hypothetical protein WR25_19539 [Diploscapter pachys]|uniref:isopentenyl-diphosphate Delta-isomerase n=1 Tax=Diploscapter pachys TaxID=2018661 RepID=A0A2A2JEB6_9BILA|nr:hypothetical protein WR25_19539 [Diploscapter pachys]
MTRFLCTTAQRLVSPMVDILASANPIQAEFMKEVCIAVDEHDNILGSATKAESHHVDSMVLHRAFSVFAFTPDKKLILQKRSATKITFPGLWTNTCCSHPLFVENEKDGETGVVRAAIRKIDHELGVGHLEKQDMKVQGRFLYKALMADSPWGEHELDYALIYRNLDLNRIRINEEEVSDVKAVESDELMEWIHKEPTSFSPWFSLFYRLEYLQKCDPATDMHSIYSRANALFAFTLWVLAAVTAACFLSTAFTDYNNSNVEIAFKDSKVLVVSFFQRKYFPFLLVCLIIDSVLFNYNGFFFKNASSKLENEGISFFSRSVVDYANSDEKSDLGLLDFSIKADFTNMFNWNVKQLFLYLVAEYTTKENVVNQVVLWDKIVLRSERVLIDERRLKPKYYFMDDGSHLLNHQNITLVLRYNVIPNSGYLRLSQASGQIAVQFPGTYTTARS